MERLLNFLVSIRRLPPLSELSGDEERMLFELRALWQKRGTMEDDRRKRTVKFTDVAEELFSRLAL